MPSARPRCGLVFIAIVKPRALLEVCAPLGQHELARDALAEIHHLGGQGHRSCASSTHLRRGEEQVTRESTKKKLREKAGLVALLIRRTAEGNRLQHDHDHDQVVENCIGNCCDRSRLADVEAGCAIEPTTETSGESTKEVRERFQKDRPRAPGEKRGVATPFPAEGPLSRSPPHPRDAVKPMVLSFVSCSLDLLRHAGRAARVTQ